MHLNETVDAGLQCLMPRKSFPRVSSALMQIIGASGFYSRKPWDFEQYPLNRPMQEAEWPPKEVHTLIPGICECVTSPGKQDYIDVIRAGLKYGDYPGSSNHISS